MLSDKAVFVGPRLRRLRRDLGLTQNMMAEELGLSPSYIALIERNQRPLTAKVLLKLASIYDVDLAKFAGDGGVELTQKIEEILKDPLYGELDLSPSEPEELAIGHPALAEAFVRVHKAYRESQLALADRAGQDIEFDPIEETRAFLVAEKNYFAELDAKAEAIGLAHEGLEALRSYLDEKFGYKTRRLPQDLMVGSVRRFDLHRKELVLAEGLEVSAEAFQIALQIAYVGFGKQLEDALNRCENMSDSARRISRRALANYTAGAILMPYKRFYKAAEKSRYDIQFLARLFRTSFEQVSHRLTTLQKPGAEGVPFFFIRVDAAGNVSKRLDGSNFPFARHGGSCPLWALHSSFKTPREVVTQLLELPDGAQFFSISRTVSAGGETYSADRAERAIALGCSIEHAERLVYAETTDLKQAKATPIGVSCRLCHRGDCLSRSEPPIGRKLLADDNRRAAAPFLFDDEG